MQYNALNQLVTSSYGNGAVNTWTYNSPMSRPASLQVGTSVSPGSVLSRTYAYDAVGNVATISDSQVGTQTFGYDQRDRLISAPSETYAYDALGNLTSKTGVGSYSYPAGGQAHPHSPNSVNGAVYNYDANGNITSGGGRSYVWNYDNKPANITGADGVTEYYGYDADGERVSRTRSGLTTYYIGGVYEEDSNGTQRVQYQFNGQIIGQNDNVGGGFYLHRDHLGSATVTSYGTVSSNNRANYDSWGKVTSGNLPQTKLNFTGQKLDGTGLLYYHARLYDPVLGRFISPDSIIPSPGNPQSLNRYSYVLNNPLKYTDPSGHCEKKSDGNPDTGNDAKAACWNWYYDIKRFNNWSYDPDDLWTWGNDAMAHLHSWVTLGIRFSSEKASLGEGINRKEYAGVNWTAKDIEAVINSLDVIKGYLDSVKITGDSFKRALGIAGSGLLKFNKVAGAGAGEADVLAHQINIQDPAGFGLEYIIHEVGHMVDYNAGVRLGYKAPSEWWSDNNWGSVLVGSNQRESFAIVFSEVARGISSPFGGKILSALSVFY